MDESLASAKKTNEAGMAMANAELGKMKDEREFIKEIAQNNKKHTDLFGRESKQFKQLKWLMGLTESEIVKSAGNPSNAFEGAPSAEAKNAPNARYLTYFNQYAIDGVGYTRDNNGNYIGSSTTVIYEIQIELRQRKAKSEYRAIDYKMFAENGGCRDLSWFNQFSR